MSTMVPEDYRAEISLLPSGRVYMVDRAGQITVPGVGGSPTPLLGMHGRYSWYIKVQS